MDTKTTLLDHAEALARTRGFDAFSYADLATEVGIRKPSIHHHFPGKADLALALMSRYREAFGAELARIRDCKVSGKDQLAAWLALYRTALCDGSKLCLCVAFSASRDSFTPEVLAQINGFHRDSLFWLTETYNRGNSDGSLAASDPSQAAHACLALAEGAQLMARAAVDPSLFDRATATLTL